MQMEKSNFDHVWSRGRIIQKVWWKHGKAQNHSNIPVQANITSRTAIGWNNTGYCRQLTGNEITRVVIKYKKLATHIGVW